MYRPSVGIVTISWPRDTGVVGRIGEKASVGNPVFLFVHHGSNRPSCELGMGLGVIDVSTKLET